MFCVWILFYIGRVDTVCIFSLAYSCALSHVDRWILFMGGRGRGGGYRRAAGIALFFQVIYTSIGHGCGHAVLSSRLATFAFCPIGML